MDQTEGGAGRGEGRGTRDEMEMDDQRKRGWMSGSVCTASGKINVTH